MIGAIIRANKTNKEMSRERWTMTACSNKKGCVTVNKNRSSQVTYKNPNSFNDYLKLYYDIMLKQNY